MGKYPNYDLLKVIQIPFLKWCMLFFIGSVTTTYGQQLKEAENQLPKSFVPGKKQLLENSTFNPNVKDMKAQELIIADSIPCSIDSVDVFQHIELVISDLAEEALPVEKFGLESENPDWMFEYFNNGPMAKKFPKDKISEFSLSLPDLEGFHKKLDKPKRKYQVLSNSERIDKVTFEDQKRRSQKFEIYLATSPRPKDFYFLNNSIQAGYYATEKLVLGAGMNRFSTKGGPENSILFYSSRFLSKNIFFYSEGGRRLSVNKELNRSGKGDSLFMRTGLGTDYKLVENFYMRFLTQLPIYENNNFLTWRPSDIQVSVGLGIKIH